MRGNRGTYTVLENQPDRKRRRRIDEADDEALGRPRSLRLAGGSPVWPPRRRASANPPPAITTPDKVDSRLGTLEFKDGAPSKATLDKVYDHLDFTHAFEAFVNTMQGVSIHAIRKGLRAPE